MPVAGGDGVLIDGLHGYYRDPPNNYGFGKK